jgi:hypothetical protein
MGIDDRDPTDNGAAPAEDDESEVAGHMHPILTEQMGRARQQDFMIEAERDRRGAQARPTGRDGGILARMRRRTEN